MLDLEPIKIRQMLVLRNGDRAAINALAVWDVPALIAEVERLRSLYTVEAITQRLDRVHFSGNCFGPSPMSAIEIARALADQY